MTDNSQNQAPKGLLAVQTAVIKASVVSGLGYPNGREVSSQEPTGWLVPTRAVATIEKQVSRETSR